MFNCSATDDYGLVNITLYHNISGTWLANNTKALTGTSDYETFTINNIPDGNYIWNCLAFDNASQSVFGNTNFSVNVSYATGNLTISSLSSLYSNNTLHIFEVQILNNGGAAINNISWQLDAGNSYTINNTQNISLNSNENTFIFVDYNYTTKGIYTVKANITNGSISDVETLNVNIGDLIITNFDDINVQGTNVIFEAVVKNNLENHLSLEYFSLNDPFLSDLSNWNIYNPLNIFSLF